MTKSVQFGLKENEMDLKEELKKVLAKEDKKVKKGHGDDACCPELAAELCRNREALLEALCANCCACHAAGCCPSEE